MKFKNMKTGEIYEACDFCVYNGEGNGIRTFLKTLAELNEELKK